MKKIIIENTWLPYMEHGWGNGYVLLPKDHKCYGEDYTTLNDIVTVHGGLTWAEEVDAGMIERHPHSDLNSKDIGKWMVGFDTIHGGDNQTNWTKERVIEETDLLFAQMEVLNK